MVEKNPVEELLVKPSVIISIYDLEQKLRNWGLTTRDIHILIQQRTKPKIPLKYIKATLEAAKRLEDSLKRDEK